MMPSAVPVYHDPLFSEIRALDNAFFFLKLKCVVPSMSTSGSLYLNSLSQHSIMGSLSK